MDEDDKLNITSSAGDLAYQQNNHTMLGIVMSARLVHMHSRSTDVSKSGGDEEKPMEEGLVGDETSRNGAPEFVVSTGIIFGGTANQKWAAVDSTTLRERKTFLYSLLPFLKRKLKNETL